MRPTNTSATPHRRGRLVWVALVVAAVAMVTALATVPSYGPVAQLLVSGGLAVVGAVIVRRRPGNVVGLLALANGTLMVVNLALHQVGLRLADRGSVEEAGAVVLVAMVLFPLSAGVQVPMFLAFPDRTEPTPAARWYLTVWGLVVVIQTVIALLARPVIVVDPELILPHPFVDRQTADSLVSVSESSILLTVMLMLGTIPVLVRRWRRGGSVERRQVGWLGLAFLTYTVVAGVNTAMQPSGAVGGDRFLLIDAIAASAIPIALAVAILRLRLYDIDVIVSKTVMFVGLAGMITVVYAIVIAGSIAVVGPPSDGLGIGPPIVATAVVAVLFEPIRVRMQRWANRLVFGERATRHEVLSQTSAMLAEATGRGGADELATLLALSTGAEQALLWTREDGRFRLVGRHPVDPHATDAAIEVERLPDRTHVRDWRQVEHRGEVLGAVSIVKPRNDPLSPADADVLDDVAAGAGLLFRRLALTHRLEQRVDEVRRSRRRLVTAQDSERRRLERDLHDGAQQRVVALKVKLGIARTLAERAGDRDLAELIEGLGMDAQQTAVDLRNVAHGIYPALLASDGLVAALGALTSSNVEVRIHELDRYPPEIEQTLYFAVVEALERCRLEGADRATVEAASLDGEVHVHVEASTCTSDVGLDTVRDRVAAFGGTTTVDDDGRGLRVRLPTTSTVRS